MWHYKIKLSYKGSHYFGWQSQPEIEKATIQDTVHQALKNICKFQPCQIIGASRTDAGVHAQGQIAKASLSIELNSEKLKLGMNSLLPKDVRVMECEACPESFNPIKDCKSKTYHYYFSFGAAENPLLNELATFISGPVDFERIQEAAKLFIGEHDFSNFCSSDSKAASPVRSVHMCEAFPVNFEPFGNNIYCLKVVGNGYLKHMIRYMAGALLLVGKKRASGEDIIEYLKEKKEHKLAPKAKARGLHLIEVAY